jgi:hypothetical protein
MMYTNNSMPDFEGEIFEIEIINDMPDLTLG